MKVIEINLDEISLDGWRPWTEDLIGEQNGWLKDQWCMIEIVQSLSGHCWSLDQISKIVSITAQIPFDKVSSMVQELVVEGVLEPIEPARGDPIRYQFKKGAKLQFQFIVP